MKAALFEGVQGGTWRATVGVIVFDSELRYVVWNPFMEQFMGVSARDVIGKRTIDVFPQDPATVSEGTIPANYLQKPRRSASRALIRLLGAIDPTERIEESIPTGVCLPNPTIHPPVARCRQGRRFCGGV